MLCKTTNNVTLVGLVDQDTPTPCDGYVSFCINVLCSNKKARWGAGVFILVKVRMITEHPTEWADELAQNSSPVKVLGCLVNTDDEGTIVQARRVEFVKRWQEISDLLPTAASNE